MKVAEDRFSSVYPADYKMDIHVPGHDVVTTNEVSDSADAAAPAELHHGWRTVKSDHQYQMNGDLSGFIGLHEKAPDENIGNQEARNRLSRWMGYTPTTWTGPLQKFYEAAKRTLLYSFTFWKPDGAFLRAMRRFRRCI